MFYTVIISAITLLSTISNAVADVVNVREPKMRICRVTGYVPKNKIGAINKPIVIGKTAAVSRNCMYLLGEDIYVEGHGTWKVNDLTARWIEDKFRGCTIDLSVPTEQHARKIGNKHKRVTRIGYKQAY